MQQFRWLRYLTPFFAPEVQDWALEARLLRWLTLVWALVGLVVMFSASYPVADAEFGDGWHYFKRQAVWMVLGLVAFNLITRSRLRYLIKTAHLMVLVVLVLILLTLISGVGTTVNGATRWIAIGPFLLQPSELIKPFLVLQAAYVFGQWRQLKWSFRLGWLGVFAVVLGAILLQPNLSTTALCGMSLWLIATAAGLPWLQLGSVALAGLTLGITSISLQEYQQRRVMSFLDPWADPKGDGYQLIQSLLAVGSGGPWGSGYGMSQQKLFYLPIQYTDFIFSVFAEEFGFVGSITLLLMLVIYATLALIVAMKCHDAVKRLVAMGVMVFLVGQSLLNVGVATGALPTTGLPLPLFSYGGSSVISSFVLAGLLVRTARECSEAEVIFLHGRKRPKRRKRLR
jgi:cell division protein FtsW